MEATELPVRWSNLHHLAQSPKHYLERLTHPKESTPAMNFGTVVHAYVLGGARKPIVVYEAARTGNAWKDFKAANAGALIITIEEHERALRCADAVRVHPEASNVLAGNFELEVDWSIDGRACQSHIDAAGLTWVGELKTSTCAEPEWFKRQATDMGYHAQLAWYVDALASMGRTIERASICVVEVQAPFEVTVLDLTPSALAAGRRLNRLWWDRLRASEASGEWPGYTKAAVSFDVVERPARPTLVMPDGEVIAA